MTIQTSFPRSGSPPPPPAGNKSLRLALYRLRQSPLSVIGLVMVVFILFAGVIGPELVPFPEDATGNTRMEARLTAPNET